MAFKLTTLLAVLIWLSGCAFLRRPAPPAVFQWPLKKYTITQKFLPYKRPPHLGLDLKAPLGSPVLSSHSGAVVYAGYRLTGYGKTVIVEHRSKKWASLYAHLQSIKVKTGQRLKRGEALGALGATGRASGPHLHFELMKEGKVINPLLALP